MTSDARSRFRRAIPVWLIVLLFLLFYWGMVYFDTQGGWQPMVYKPYHSLEEVALYQPPPPAEGCDRIQGRVLFEQYCGLCHNNDGAGKPGQAPPLDGSEWVVGPVNRLIRIPQLGLSGQIKVKGQDLVFPNGMPPMGASLKDEELANVLCYIRSSWSNKSGPVKVEDVARVRKEAGNRAEPWSEAELQKVP